MYDIFNRYPYINLTDRNLDLLTKAIREMQEEVKNFVSINAVKYANPIQWSINRQYEKNTIVIDPLTGTAFISVQPVPSGVSLTRTEYWTVVFDLSQFITKAASNFANTYEHDITTTATMPTGAGDWVVWNSTLYVALTSIHAGDAYVVNGNIKRMTVEDFYDLLMQAIHSLDEELDTEIRNRTDADSTLQSNIDAEARARGEADTTLQGNIDTEARAREEADTTLQGNIDAEARARQQADELLSRNIDTLSNYKENFKNIKDYGAIGDGVLHPLSEFYGSLDAARVDFPFAQSLSMSIDVAAMQKAINNDLLVYAPVGTYIFNTSVVLPQGKSVTIQGEDKMHTIFKSVVTSITMIIFERVSGPSVFTLRDVFFTCETGVTGVTAIYFHGLIDGSTRYEDNWLTVQRCNFFYLKRAMDLYTCSNIYVDHCYAVNTEIFAYLGRAASFAHFSNILTLLGWATIYAEDALEDGISNGLYCYDVIGVFNTNLTFRVHGWQAVYIQNCSADFQSGVDGGYFIYGCQDVTINGCWCAGTDVADSNGIRLWNSYNTHVSDCTIEHFNRGIRVDSPAYGGITISNNVFLANMTIDISVHTGSGTVITGNTFKSGVTPIGGYDGTSHNIADNNVMIGTPYPMGLGDGSLVDRNVYI